MSCLEENGNGDYCVNRKKWKENVNQRMNVKDMYQREMFLRFFEELESYIEGDSLNKNVIRNTFAYYALQAASLQEDFVEDYNNGNWILFKKFVEEMKKIED